MHSTHIQYSIENWKDKTLQVEMGLVQYEQHSVAWVVASKCLTESETAFCFCRVSSFQYYLTF